MRAAGRVALVAFLLDRAREDAIAAARTAVEGAGGAVVFSSLDRPHDPWPAAADLADADLVTVFGGDGAVLRALRMVVGGDVRVLGVDFGTLDFLAGVSQEQVQAALTTACGAGLTSIEVATATVRDGEGRTHVAVNDVVLIGDRPGRVVTLAPRLYDVEWPGVPCDGLVAATPLGSTAYNLAAGGPVLGLGLEGLTTTFISPHTLGARAFVLPRGRTLSVRNVSRGRSSVLLLVDGDEVAPVADGATVEIGFGDGTAHLALMPGVSLVARFRDLFSSVPLRRRDMTADGRPGEDAG